MLWLAVLFVVLGFLLLAAHLAFVVVGSAALIYAVSSLCARRVLPFRWFLASLVAGGFAPVVLMELSDWSLRNACNTLVHEKVFETPGPVDAIFVVEPASGGISLFARVKGFSPIIQYTVEGSKEYYEYTLRTNERQRIQAPTARYEVQIGYRSYNWLLAIESLTLSVRERNSNRALAEMVDFVRGRDSWMSKIVDHRRCAMNEGNRPYGRTWEDPLLEADREFLQRALKPGENEGQTDLGDLKQPYA